MIIKSDNINYHVMRLIKEITQNAYEFNNNEKDLRMMVGEITGIIEMAEAMKEVLKE